MQDDKRMFLMERKTLLHSKRLLSVSTNHLIPDGLERADNIIGCNNERR